MNNKKIKLILKIFKNPFIIGGIIGILSIHLIKGFSNSRLSAPPPLLDVPSWSLIDQNNNIITSDDLNGKIIIANLFFTRCTTVCPKLINAMKKLHKNFKNFDNLIHFISISIDPDHDNYKVLKKYAVDNNISYPNWSFLTGKKYDIFNTVVKKMRLHSGKKQYILNENDDEYDIDHFAQLILFDKNCNLRGFFSIENHILAALERSAKLLLSN